MKTNKIEIPKDVFEKMFLQQGGERKAVHKELTGQVLNPLPENSAVEPNAEIEVHEFVKTQDGVKKALGEPHEKGGTPVKLEDGDRVLSDYLKVGGDFAKAISKEYDINVKASDTYAKALDKYLKKIGHSEATQEMEDYIAKLDKQKQTVKDDTTLALNQEVLMEEIKEYGTKLEELEPVKAKMFDLLFTAQESTKEKQPEDNVMQAGGTIQDLIIKYNIEPNKLKELLPQYNNGGELPKYQVAGVANVPQADLEFQRMKGRGYEQSNPYFFQNPGREGRLEDWTNSQMYKAEYELGDVEAKKQRFKDLADNAGVSYTEADFKDSKAIDAFAGKLQKYIIENKPELAVDYGKKVEPTREGLQYLVDNKLIKPEDYGIKIANGKVARGSYDTLSTEANKKLMSVISNLPQDKVKDYALTNYNDNLGYFRGIKTRDQELSEDEYKKFTSENTPVGGGYYETKVPGVYIRPTKIGETTPSVIPATTETTTTPIETAPLVAKEEAKRRSNAGMLLLPDQSPLTPPSMLAPAKFTPRLVGYEYAQISPEQELAEIGRSQAMVKNELAQMPDAQRAATLASMDANNAQAISKVLTNTSRYNAQAKERSDANRAQVQTQQSQADMASASQYQQLMGRELEAYDADLQRFYDKLTSNQVNNWKTIEMTNQFNALNPNVTRTNNGYEVINLPTYTSPEIGSNLPQPQTKKKPKGKKGGRFKK